MQALTVPVAYDPAGHFRHLSDDGAPKTELKVPFGQLVHAVEPVIAA